MKNFFIISTQDSSSIEEVISNNLLPGLLMTRKYVRACVQDLKTGNPKVITSIFADRGYSRLITYGSSKAELVGSARSLGKELSPKGFRVNCVAHGHFESNLSSSLDQSRREQIIRRIPLGRFAFRTDVIPTVKFLLSDKSNFTTGIVIKIDGVISV